MLNVYRLFRKSLIKQDFYSKWSSYLKNMNEIRNVYIIKMQFSVI